MSFESELEGSIPFLRSVAGKLARGRMETDDLVQETVVRALSGKDGFDGRNMRGWLFIILRNYFLNEVQRKSLHRGKERQIMASSCGVWVSQVPAQPDSRWVGQDAVDAVNSLIPEFRDVVVAVEVEGLRYREAAEKLGCPVGTIMSRLHRARAAFSVMEP